MNPGMYSLVVASLLPFFLFGMVLAPYAGGCVNSGLSASQLWQHITALLVYKVLLTD